MIRGANGRNKQHEKHLTHIARGDFRSRVYFRADSAGFCCGRDAGMIYGVAVLKGLRIRGRAETQWYGKKVLPYNSGPQGSDPFDAGEYTPASRKPYLCAKQDSRVSVLLAPPPLTGTGIEMNIEFHGTGIEL